MDLHVRAWVCVRVCVRDLESMHHSFPLSSEEAFEAQGTHQPFTHNYLKELGESSCPQIIVKTPHSQKAPYAPYVCPTTVGALSESFSICVFMYTDLFMSLDIITNTCV